MNAAKLSPRPLTPYPGLTVSGLRTDIKNFRSACLHDNSSYGNHSLCTLFNVVETALDKNEGDMYMNIADFSTYYHVKQKPVATGFGGYGGFGS